MPLHPDPTRVVYATRSRILLVKCHCASGVRPFFESSLEAFDKEHPETMRQVTDSDEKHGSTTPFVNVDEGLLDGRNNLWNKVGNECVLCAVNKKKLRARNKNRSKRTPALASPLLSQKTQLRPKLPSKHRHLTF